MLIHAGKFLLVGILVTAIHLAISYLIVQLDHGLLSANCTAFVIAFFISYFLQSRFTFKHAYTFLKLAKFALVALIALTVSQVVAYLSLTFSVPLFWVLLFSGLTPPAISFLLNYFFVFKDAPSSLGTLILANDRII